MKTESKILRWYWKWNESPIRDTVHWAVFLAIGLTVVIHLVSSISTNALDATGIGASSKATAAMLNEQN